MPWPAAGGENCWGTAVRKGRSKGRREAGKTGKKEEEEGRPGKVTVAGVALEAMTSTAPQARQAQPAAGGENLGGMVLWEGRQREGGQEQGTQGLRKKGRKERRRGQAAWGSDSGRCCTRDHGQHSATDASDRGSERKLV